jgi:serine/threonine-protein kinase
LKSGVVLGGKYRLDHPIGKGGMGEVWRARRLDLDADVAIKVMSLGGGESDPAFARFQREARAAAGLRSPHVVQIFDFGRDESTGTPFIAMELLEGESLRQRLARERVLAPAVACEIVIQIGRALARAHAAQIVHRDLKPDNVFLVANDDQLLVKLLDFGIAKSETKPGEALPTATGVLLGTPYYMSPEQLQSSRAVDGRTDLWSLCVIAYECLTGAKPFKASTLPELAMQIALGRAEPPSHLGTVPAGFDEWFARGIAVDPERRYQSATELIDALRVVARETRMVGGSPPDLTLGATQGVETDSLSSQVAAARAFGEAPTTRDARLPERRRRRARNLGAAALGLLFVLTGGYYLAAGVKPSAPAGSALAPALDTVAPVSAAAEPLAPAAAAISPPPAPVLPGPGVSLAPPALPSPRSPGEAARSEARAARDAARDKRRTARDAAEQRARRARSKAPEASAAPPVVPEPPPPAPPAARIDAFDQQ